MQPNQPVTFVIDEPICMLVPQRRGELEEFRPEICPLDRNSGIGRQHDQWAQGRQQFLTELGRAAPMPNDADGRSIIFMGAHADAVAPEHQLKLRLSEFVQGPDLIDPK